MRIDKLREEQEKVHIYEHNEMKSLYSCHCLFMNGTRLRSELKKLQKTKIKGIRLIPNEDNLFEWKCILDGPDGTPYQGGTYAVRLKIPQDYPFHPPKAFFETRIFHPNIDFVNGSVCLNILKDAWSPRWDLEVCLINAVHRIECCSINPSNAVDAE